MSLKRKIREPLLINDINDEERYLKYLSTIYQYKLSVKRENRKLAKIVIVSIVVGACIFMVCYYKPLANIIETVMAHKV